MSPQTFQIGDLASVFALILLEGLLSADNALVLAIMVRHLPKEQQRKALLYGLGGAFVFRFLAILFAVVVLKWWWLQAVGAGYLLFLPAKHFWLHRDGAEKKKAATGGFWATVVAVELTDIAFAIDSVLAGVAFVNNRQDKIWVVFAGAILGIVLLRLAAGVFIRLLEKYPVLDHVAYLLVGWVGIKLAFLSIEAFERTHPYALPWEIHQMPHWLFWAGLGLIGGIGTVVAVKQQSHVASELDEQASLAEDAADLDLDE